MKSAEKDDTEAQRINRIFRYAECYKEACQRISNIFVQQAT